LASSWMWCHVQCQRITNILEEYAAYIFTVEDVYPKDGAAGTSKTLVTCNQSMWLHIQEDSNLNIHCYENLKFLKVIDIFQ
jgi:hypothetical protein